MVLVAIQVGHALGMHHNEEHYHCGIRGGGLHGFMDQS